MTNDLQRDHVQQTYLWYHHYNFHSINLYQQKHYHIIHSAFNILNNLTWTYLGLFQHQQKVSSQIQQLSYQFPLQLPNHPN
jgi:hypothetical protein